MTREEAIAVLKEMRRVLNVDKGIEFGEEIEALDVIFQILEQEPNVQPIKIPEGATNGDVIKTVFGVKDIIEMTMTTFVVLTNNDSWLEFKRSWWNAPYEGKV